MIKSAAIIKTLTLSKPKELRLQKKKAKKQAAEERKAIKVHFPSPMNVRVREVVEPVVVADVIEVVEVAPVDDSPPTRDEMEFKARELGIKFDGRTSDKKLDALIVTALGV
jgi:hypothetical protein